MVKGLEHFSAAFEMHKEQYVMIGGAACAINCEEAGIPFRKTEDLDVVLIIEDLTKEFAGDLWQYIKDAKYRIRNKKDSHEGDFILHRFANPEVEGFPKQIELFSIPKEGIELVEEQHLTPLPTPEEISNFSAILVDPDYYTLIKDNRSEVENVSTLPPHVLIPLKARAWLGNRELLETGAVKKGNVDKHPLDIFTLNDIVTETEPFKVPQKIHADIELVCELFTDPAEQANLVAAAGAEGASLDFKDLVTDLTDAYVLS